MLLFELINRSLQLLGFTGCRNQLIQLYASMLCASVIYWISDVMLHDSDDDDDDDDDVLM